MTGGAEVSPAGGARRIPPPADGAVAPMPGPRARLGECPVRDRRYGWLLWLDIEGAALYAFEPGGALRAWSLPERICSFDVPRPGWQPPAALAGRPFVGCGDSGLAWIGVGDEEVVIAPIADPERDRPENRYNDGKFGPDGRYWAGTMHRREEAPTGSLYAFGPDGGCAILGRGYRVSNGPAFSPDGKTVYHADSPRGEVYAFDLTADGGLSRERTLLRFAEDEGKPDGMTTDCEGSLWIAVWDGGRVEKVSPEGTRLGAVEVPTLRPTSCAFVDDECTEILVTSASVGVPDTDELAGRSFRVRLG